MAEPSYRKLAGIAAILLMIVLFSGLITVLFRVRGRVLAWQKELVR